MAVALTLYEDGLCNGCGHPLSETTDPDADHHYVAPLPTRCYACTVIAMRTPEYEKAAQPDALRFRADRVEDVMAAEHTEQGAAATCPP